ncbi:MAG: tail fiber domain-containing protein [Phycisphaerales bacterium]
MKQSSIVGSLLLLAGLATGAAPAAAQPGTSFTYQGSLSQSGSAVDAPVDMIFRLFDLETGGIPIAAAINQTVTPVNGVFSIDLDFGTAPFVANDALWLEVVVEGTVLGRQKLNAAPFSINTRGLNVNAGGNVGIGTTNPGRALVVRSNSGPMLGLEGPSNPGLRFASDNSNALGTSWSVFQDSNSGDLIFRDSFDGITRMAIDSVNGRVGIGNTNPAATLDVNGGALISDDVGIGTTPDAFDRLSVVGDGGGEFNVFNLGTTSGRQLVGGFFGNNAGPFARFQRVQGGNYADIGLASDGDFELTINDQPLVTVRPDGNIGIGNTNPGFPLTIESDSAGNTIGLRSNAGGSDWHLDFAGNGLGLVETGATERVRLNDGGNVTVPTGDVIIPGGGVVARGESRFGGLFDPISSTVEIFGRSQDTFALVVGTPDSIFRFSVNNNGTVATQCGVICASDERLKDDITNLESPLDKIMALRSVSFTWKDETLAKRGTQLGFVAQELQQVLPELIGESPDGMLGVDYASLTSVLTGAVQEQQAEMETMQAQIAALEAQMASMNTPRSVVGASMVWPVLLGGGVLGGLAVARRRVMGDTTKA